MDYLLQDLRYGFRQLVKHPLFSLVAVVALGFGINAVSTQLSVVNGLFFKGLPFPAAEKLAHLERINVERQNFNAEVPIPEFLEWEKQQDSFSGLAGYYVGTANLTVGDRVERYDGCFISPNAFELLNINAFLGRTLSSPDNDPNAAQVVVLSHRIWQRDLGSDPDIAGKNAILNGRPVTIVGVMPEGFGFPVREDLWVPIFNQQKRAEMQLGDDVMSLEVFGRLKDGVSFEQARSNMAVIARNLETAYPEFQKGFRDIDVKPFIEEFVGGGEIKPLVSVMLLITFLILVIACANVANLLLARAMRRQKEVAIRSALGASRNRILSQFLTESLIISALGALLAIIITQYDVQEINATLVEMNSPFWMDFTPDWKVLMLVAVITIITGVLAGIVPAYRASRINQNEILKDDSRTSTSLHLGIFSKALVIIQISVAAVILTLVYLFTRSVTNAIDFEYSYNSEGVMSARIGMFEETYPTAQECANLIRQLLQALEARPEIESVSTSHRYQFLNAPGIQYEIPGRAYAVPADREFCRFQYVSEGFFETMGMQLIRGETFKPEDFTAGYPRKVIVNKALAQREWPGENPIGKQFQPHFGIGEEDSGNIPLVEVAGLMENMQEAGIFVNRDDDGAGFIAPLVTPAMPRFITILVKPSGNIDLVIPVIREELRKLDSNLPIYMTGTPREINDQAMVQFRFFSSIFRQFGILATFLAAVGIYGVITFSVNQRIMEFGIRQALGATRQAVLKLVYAHALKQLMWGFFFALLLLSPMILLDSVRSSMTLFFHKIDPNSIIPYLFSFGFVAFIALAAATPPAIKAARIHPAQALRYE